MPAGSVPGCRAGAVADVAPERRCGDSGRPTLPASATRRERRCPPRADAGHDDGHHHDHDHPDHDDCGCHEPPDDPYCDPDLIDDLKCQAEGIAAQAKYNEETQPALQKAREDYAKARGDYRTARTAATVQVQDLRHQVKQLIERIRCQITQDEVTECLDRAFRHICRRLEKCGYGGGCCSTDPASSTRPVPTTTTSWSAGSPSTRRG